MQYAQPIDLKPYFLTLDELPGPIDWRDFFGNANPVELDVGCGRGLYLFNASLQNPDTNYLGIEIDLREGRRGAQRLLKREAANARVLGGDARVAFDKFIASGSVSAVHVYFPDPWWKRKHKKRILFTDQFADEVAAVLQPGGMLHHWTDVKDYFEIVQALLDHHNQFETLPPPPERQAEFDMDYQTSFERKKRQAGSPIYRGQWQRK